MRGSDFEEIARQRLQRIEAAINLEEPDKVPLDLLFDFGFRAKWYGITTYEFFFEYGKAKNAILKTAIDFPTDFPPLPVLGSGSLLGFALKDYPEVSKVAGVLTGPMHDILRDKYTRWPGRELSPNVGSFQFLGGEFMKPEEYDDLISDPFGFIAEVVIPRAHQSLEKPGSIEAMEALIKVAVEGLKYLEAVDETINNLTRIGYPSLLVSVIPVPLDFLGDFLRTIPGILIDLRKRPDKVKEACDVLMKKVLSYRITSVSNSAGFALIPLHLNEYLSQKFYYEFYWPYLKRIITELHYQGIKCQIAFGGKHDVYLKSILELPRGWGVAFFEKTDVRKAKRVLEGHTCVMGGIPPTFLLNATPREVEDHVKKLLEEVMPGGGFILATSTAIPAETPAENVKSVIRAVEKYGIYRRN